MTNKLVPYWIFAGLGVGLVGQGLLVFEVFGLPFSDWEKRIAEKKLGRPL